jgi:hypothetical protein
MIHSKSGILISYTISEESIIKKKCQTINNKNQTSTKINKEEEYFG